MKITSKIEISWVEVAEQELGGIPPGFGIDNLLNFHVELLVEEEGEG